MHPDLFNQSPADWVADPRKTFDAWLSARHFRGSSADVYRAQWHHFLDWLAERNKTLLNTEPALIDEFVSTLDVKREQRARYLRIMERVFDDMFKEAPTAGNPARPISRAIDAQWADAHSNAPMGFLSETERVQIWRELERSIGPGGQDISWRDLRDRAMAAVMLGAGLKLSEVETLKEGNVLFEEHLLLVEAADVRFSRRVPLPAHVAEIVERWLDARAEAAVAGDLAFPAGRGGRPMHKATALRALDDLVEQAGLMDMRTARISPQTLRNAYAATLIQAGESDELLAERLGFAQLLSSKRLRAAWHDWQRSTERAAAIQPAVARANAL